MHATPYRHWFRFSLRMFFVAMTFLSVAFGWQLSVVRERQALVRELQTKGMFSLTTAQRWIEIHLPAAPATPPARISITRRWLGDEAIQQVVYLRMQGFAESDLERIAEILPEAEVHESLPEPCHPGCFPAGTLVETPQGPRPIDSIETDDRIITVGRDGQTATSQVQSVFVTNNRLWRVVTEDATLITTETQPLCASRGEFVQAGSLQPGDEILLWQEGSARTAKVKSITRTDRGAKVYNLIVGRSEVFVAGGFLARSKPPGRTADAR